VKIKHVHYEDVKAEIPEEKGAIETKIRWLVTKNDGAEHFAMRLFEIEPGGNTPWHRHNWEHEMFILEGTGVAVSENGEEEFKEGDVFFIPPMEWHQFKNTGKNKLKFLCLVPYKDGK